jgi:hypothetical protein
VAGRRGLSALRRAWAHRQDQGERRKRVRIGLHKWGDCQKQFTVKVGTVSEHGRIPLHKFLQAVHLLCSSKKGISAHHLHRILEVQYKTAWFLAHRIREAMRHGSLAPSRAIAPLHRSRPRTRHGQRSRAVQGCSAEGCVRTARAERTRQSEAEIPCSLSLSLSLRELGAAREMSTA